MIVIYECKQTPVMYAKKGRNNIFPDIDLCPNCKAKHRLQRHGFYERNAVEKDNVYRIPICRLKCSSCGKTVSLLPDFLIPFYQYTLSVVMKRLKERLVEKKRQTTDGIRQLVTFYAKRFVSQLTQVEMFFRDHGKRGVIPGGKEKTINLLEMISAFGEASFLRRSKDHFSSSFMAN